MRRRVLLLVTLLGLALPGCALGPCCPKTAEEAGLPARVNVHNGAGDAAAPPTR